jgi:hypothetical protein
MAFGMLRTFPNKMKQALVADGRATRGSVATSFVRRTDHGGIVLTISLQLEATDEMQAEHKARDVALDALQTARAESRWSSGSFGWTMGCDVASAASS